MAPSHTIIIALANDDGIKAAGLQALEEALKGLGDVWVVAPDRSARYIHGISLHDPMRLRELDLSAIHSMGFCGLYVCRTQSFFTPATSACGERD